MVFRCIDVSKTFFSRQGEVTALRGLDFSVGEREFVCIVGPSGCGKTTLLKIIAGLVAPTNGQVVFTDNTGDDTVPSTAMVFQDLGLFPWMSIRDNVAFGLEARGVSRKVRHARANEILEKVGLGEFGGYYPHQLSGGMRQRAAILRAFLTNPRILLMDEPFGSLDSQTRLVMQEELLRIWREYLKTVIYVTHDIEEAILLGDRVLVMSGRPGSIQADIAIDLPRPREIIGRDQPAVEAIRWRIWKMIEAEVRQDLKVRP
jgi:NitT/TauT family transport system ATP-binding protein